MPPESTSSPLGDRDAGTCDLCGEDHATDGHNAAIREQARDGKRKFLVRIVSEQRYYAWASDSAKAEDAVYWRRSSGRRAPEVDDLSPAPSRFVVEEA